MKSSLTRLFGLAAVVLTVTSGASDARSATLTTLYSFCSQANCADGANPEASLVNVDGTLFGTTVNGGAFGNGAVFSITPTGSESILHSFGSDGANPYGKLLNLHGRLYGTTRNGGPYDDGTVFSMTRTGTGITLYSFKGGSGDGAYPRAGLVNLNGTLYGTTSEGGMSFGSGGTAGSGTVFSVSSQGVEKVLYSFDGSSGANPLAGLINVNGVLYGTAIQGGVNNFGTVFSVTPAGIEMVLHSFAGGNDGFYPDADLTNVGGTLYGTSSNGGANNFGTVFSMTLAGAEMVLYSFKGGSGDGDSPQAGLINVNGRLYGTTYTGGPFGFGTVFSVTPAGIEKVIHSFAGGSSDGAYPLAGLIKVGSTLYGTTSAGGISNNGTIFKIVP